LFYLCHRYLLVSAAGFLGVLQSSNALPVVFRLREVFYRERASNVYAPWVYTVALSLVELPYLFACSFLFVLPFYFLVSSGAYECACVQVHMCLSVLVWQHR
jgi:ABC-type multidrug transport system permease subunit